MIAKSGFGLALIAVLVVNTSARAQLSNGSFETGTASGWTTLGTTTVVGTQYSVAPDSGNFHAFGTGSTATQAALETYFGMAAGSLDTQLGANTFSGAAIAQTLAVTAGDRLTFRFCFNNGEHVASTGWNDMMFLVVNGTATILADTFTPFDANWNTGYTSASFTFPATGNYTVGIGVVNVNDNALSSSFLVDTFNIIPVPEPLLLGVMCLPCVGMLRKRGSRQVTMLAVIEK